MTILVAGAGKVARALAAALTSVGADVRAWKRGDPPPPPSDVVIVAVSDRAVAEVAARLVDGGAASSSSVLLHCAGALAPEELFAPLRDQVGGVGLLHPLRALAGDASDADLSGTVFAVAGDDVGRAAAVAVAALLEGQTLVLSAEGLGRYHAAAVLVGNHLIGLLDAATGLLASEGLDAATGERALVALGASALRNVQRQGAAAALTGPIARGDVAVVARHLAALPARSRALYRATARATVALARRRPAADPALLDAIDALLRDDHD